MNKYQELIIQRINQTQITDWDEVRYDVEAWGNYTQTCLNYIDNYPVGDRVIDVGCAYGTLPVYLKTLGWKEVWGLDIIKMLNVDWIDKYDVNFMVSDIEREHYGFHHNYFDLILMFEVLEHLGHDPRHAMKQMFNITKPGGKIIISTPDRDYMYKGERYWINGINQDGHGWKLDHYGNLNDHYYIYTMDEVRKMVERPGFQVKSLDIVGTHIYCVGKKPL